jgi:hypothetical protein
MACLAHIAQQGKVRTAHLLRALIAPKDCLPPMACVRTVQRANNRTKGRMAVLHVCLAATAMMAWPACSARRDLSPTWGWERGALAAPTAPTQSSVQVVSAALVAWMDASPVPMLPAVHCVPLARLVLMARVTCVLRVELLRAITSSARRVPKVILASMEYASTVLTATLQTLAGLTAIHAQWALQGLMACASRAAAASMPLPIGPFAPFALLHRPGAEATAFPARVASSRMQTRVHVSIARADGPEWMDTAALVLQALSHQRTQRCARRVRRGSQVQLASCAYYAVPDKESARLRIEAVVRYVRQATYRYTVCAWNALVVSSLTLLKVSAWRVPRALLEWTACVRSASLGTSLQPMLQLARLVSLERTSGRT